MAGVAHTHLIETAFIGRKFKQVQFNKPERTRLTVIKKRWFLYRVHAHRTDGSIYNPLGRKELGKQAINWVAQGLRAMTQDIVQSETRGDIEGVERRMEVGEEFMETVQRFLDMNEVPKGCEEQCKRARTHYPTLYDHMQRELQRALVTLEKQGLVENWQHAHSWKLFKQQAKSGEHRNLAKAEKPSGSLGLTNQEIISIERNVEGFVDRYLELLRLEREAELAANQQSLNTIKSQDEDSSSVQECAVLSDLVAVSSSKGMGGMEIVSFRSRDSNTCLPPTSLSPGDMVCVRVSDRTTDCIRGSVHKLHEDGILIDIAIPVTRALVKLSGRSIRIDKIFDLANATTYERNCEALKQLKKVALHKDNPVVALLFGEGENVKKLIASQPSSQGQHFSQLSSQRFDQSQKEAIMLALDKQRPIIIIQGPPGTGKTSVLTELIIQSAARGDRVLVTAPTNAAVDNLVERLSQTQVNTVRVGNPVRISPAVVSRALSQLVESNLFDFRKTMLTEKAAIRNSMRKFPEDTELVKRLRKLIKTVKRREEEVPKEILSSAQVVLCTNVGAGDPLMKHAGKFDVLVMDEAGQAIEPSCWISILKSSRTVLAGDIQQLSPVVFSQEALQGGLGTSLMERATQLHSGMLSTMLRVQYRMHSVIASWASEEMYGGLVQSAPGVCTQLLSDTPGVKKTWRTDCPMLLLDTRQAYGSLMPGCEECMDYLGTGSYYNDGEADIVLQHVMALINAGVPPRTIAVQSPYLAQVHLLRTRLEEASLGDVVQAESIDSFQGREADAVVISMVRSNNLGLVGFLADKRRINVAVTRARKHVTIVCDSSTLASSNVFLRRLLQHIRLHGLVKQASDITSVVSL